MSKKTSQSDPFADREAAKYSHPIPSREFIAGFLLERHAPANYANLVSELHLSQPEELEALRRRLKAMLRDRQLERLREGYYWPTGHRVLVSGRVQAEKGKKHQVWVIPDDKSSRISLHPKDSSRVYPGNRVVVSVISAPHAQTREGTLVEVTEQKSLFVTGRFIREKGLNYVIPHGKEMPHDVLIPQGEEKNAAHGDIVVVEIDSKPSRFVEPLGRVIEVLGQENTPGIEIKTVAKAFGLSESWPDAVLKEMKTLKDTIPDSAKRGRLDIRDLPLVTIDGEDAKDFDDAVYCEPRKGGGFRLYVAIADVSYYVRPNTALDKEALVRGNSVYFPSKVIPMLPHVLSNGLCSLNPDVDRLCMVCILNISASGKVTGYEFHEAIMRSKARLTYTVVATLLKADPDSKLSESYKTILPQLKHLYQVYQLLSKEREKRGAIEFETLETRIIFGENAKINRIEPVERNEAHRLIEECMLAANVATANFLKKHKLPGLYRIHEGPPPDKLVDLRVFLNEMGLSLGGGAEPQPIHYAKLLSGIEHRADSHVIQTVLLRSLSQATYSPNNVGHFGLAYPAYCHFTSPIRRYPDLLVHRKIKLVLKGQWNEKRRAIAKTEEAKLELVRLGEHSSMTERRADEATRDASRWLKCQYIEKHVGESYEAVITGVTRFGFFAELKGFYIDGLVHVTSLQDDYYYFDPIHHRLVGERTKKTYRLGDTVKVIINHVDVHERKIDFELIGAKPKDKQPPKRGAPRERGGSSQRGNPPRKGGRSKSRKKHKAKR